MQKNESIFIIRRSMLPLLVSMWLLVARDFARVLLGHFEFTSNGWEFVRYTGFAMTAMAITSLLFLIIHFICRHGYRRLPQRLKNVFLIILLLTVFWTIHSLITVDGYSITTLDGTAKTVFLMMLGLYVGYDEESWYTVKKYIPFLAATYILLALYYITFVRYGSVVGNMVSQKPHWMLYSTGFWLLAYYLLCYDRKSVFLTLLLLFANLGIVAFSISRGWFLQTTVLYAIYLTSDKTLSKKRKRLLIACFLCFLAVGFYAMRNEIIDIITSYVLKFESATSRSSQYEVFFSQVRILDLIPGQGEYASYVYKGNDSYIYFDNSFIYYAFHFGIVFSLIMLWMPLSEGWQVLKKRKIGVPDAKIGYILFMWIAALAGASVFCAGYEISFRMLFIMILIGRAAFVNAPNRSLEEIT